VARTGGCARPVCSPWAEPLQLEETLEAVPRSYTAGPSKWPFLGARPFGVGRACGRRLHTVWHALEGAHGPSAAHGLSPYSSRRRSKLARSGPARISSGPLDMAISRGPAVWRRSGVRAEEAHRLTRTGGCTRPVCSPWAEPLQLEETFDAVPRAYPAGPSKWPFQGARPFGVGRACGRRLHTVWHALGSANAARLQPMG